MKIPPRFWVWAGVVFGLAVIASGSDVFMEMEDSAAGGEEMPIEIPEVREVSPATSAARARAATAAEALTIPDGLENWKSIRQLEMEAHPDEAGAAATRASTKAVVTKSALVVRPAGTGPQKRVLGWHPYWSTQSDIESYDYSNLTHIAYFSYEVNPATGGCANLHAWNTSPVVEWAHSNGVKVVLTATLFDAANNHALLTNSTACNALVANLVSTVTARGGDGVCIDFEGVGSWTGATKALTSFMSNLTVACHAVSPKLEVSIALPSVDWYADFDVGAYEKFGMDYCIIMGYDYYYSGSSTPGPNAPLYSSAQWGGASSWCSVDYSTRYYLNKMTNAANLMLAVPYYGRKWRAASETLGAANSGASYSTAVVYPTAESQAATYGKKWDANASVPYYTYTDTYAYQCFYDDSDSLGLKYDYVNTKNLGGIGIWALTHAPGSTALWNLIEEKFAGTGGDDGGGSGTDGEDPGEGGAPSSADADWVAQTSAHTALFYGVNSRAGLHVATGAGGAIYTSEDGSNWVARTSGATGLLMNVNGDGPLWCVVGEGGTIRMSEDGETWTAATSGTTSLLRGVAYGTNVYVACGDGGTIVRSTDGVTWTAQSSGVTVSLQGIGYGNGLFVAVGQGGTILTSPDGTTWTARTSGVTGYISDVIYGNGYYLAVGPGSRLLRSADGVTWTAQTAPVSNVYLYRAAYCSGVFKAAGAGGAIWTSSDGATWTAETSGTTNILRGISYANDQFVAVGANGTILTKGTLVSGSGGGGTVVQTATNTVWDFTAAEGWAGCTTSFTGTSNGWALTSCRVYPTTAAGGDTGYIALYTPGTAKAQSPAFAGVVTQAVTVLRPSSAGTRQVTLLASTNGGSSFATVATVAPNEVQNYTNTLAFSPPLDGGAQGVIFCASNSGTAGTVHLRYVAVNGYVETTSGGDDGGESGSGGENEGGGEEPGGEETGGTGMDETVAAQPSGALSGVVVYCSGGHGFTANDASTAWITGRGVANAVNEDMGNIDQLNYFVQAAWKAGATVVPFRPVGYQTSEVVLDNVDTTFAAGRGQVTYGGTWYDTTQTNYYYGSTGEIGYRYAYICTTGTSAWASYRPDLPVAGEYPVYTWVRHGSDRVNQLYRIHHAGGVTDVRVNHNQVGNGWVWLGHFYFEAGTNGCVNISNYAPDETNSGNVVLADGIRFGNGMGDIARGTAGISGFERELEGSRYWVQRTVMDSVGLAASLYDLSGYSDADDNVGAPPRMAYAMCRTNGWARWRRIYMGLHSNAGSGSSRGTWGLYDTRIQSSYPVYHRAQTNYAKLVALRSYNDMSAGVSSGVIPSWSAPTLYIYGSSYGEIYNSSIFTKMDTTIDEVAFHDNASDCVVLKTPAGREWLARSAVRGIIEHLSGYYSGSGVENVFAPDQPTSVQARNSGTRQVTVSWAMPTLTTASGAVPTGFLLYTSTDGRAFGNPISISGGSATNCTVSGLTTGATVFFRVCATNAGGESPDSAVTGVRVSGKASADVLVVDGFDRNDASLAPTRYFANNLAANVALIRPRMINHFDYVKEHGAALAAAGRSFDCVDNDGVTADLLAKYDKVVWILGEESTADETFSTAEQTLVSNFLSGGGCLFVSGSEIGWDLGSQGSAADKAFLTNVLRAVYFQDSAGTNRATGSSGHVLTNLTMTFNYAGLLSDMYAANYPDVFTAGSGAALAAAYGASAAGANGAAIQYSNVTYRTVTMGIPFETISTAATRASVMTRVMDFFDAGKGVADSNTNGIPDDWELEYFGSITGAVASADSDADGMNNLQEYIAGTDPTNAASVLCVTHAACENGASESPQVVLQWESVPGRTYAIDEATDLTVTNRAWTSVAEGLSSTPPLNIYTTPPAVNSNVLFYRIRTQVP